MCVCLIWLSLTQNQPNFLVPLFIDNHRDTKLEINSVRYLKKVICFRAFHWWGSLKVICAVSNVLVVFVGRRAGLLSAVWNVFMGRLFLQCLYYTHFWPGVRRSVAVDWPNTHSLAISRNAPDSSNVHTALFGPMQVFLQNSFFVHNMLLETQKYMRRITQCCEK